MAITYREIAIEEMLRTVEAAMSQVIDWWGDLPPPMKEAIEQFRIQLGSAIDSVEYRPQGGHLPSERREAGTLCPCQSMVAPISHANSCTRSLRL